LETGKEDVLPEQEDLPAPQETLAKPDPEEVTEGSIDGQVTWTEGPMQDVTVATRMATTRSDPQGNFLLEHIPIGIVTITAKSPSGRFYDSSVDVLVEAGQRKNLPIFLKEITGTVEGDITDEDGKFLAGVEISSLFRVGKDVMTAKTNEQGHYFFTDIPQGNYYVRAKVQGYMIEGAFIEVTGGKNAVTSFTLKPGSLSLMGRVVNKAGSPVDCEIQLWRKGSVIARVKTLSSGDGAFAFTDLIPEVYEVVTSSPGMLPKHWFGKLEKSEMVNFELEAVSQPDKSKERRWTPIRRGSFIPPAGKLDSRSPQ